MAYLKPKNIHGQTYWYVVESRRVNRQVKTVNLAYLCKADDILSRWRQLSRPKDCLKSYSHGAVAVMLSLAKRLGIAEIINTHIKPPRRPITPDMPVTSRSIPLQNTEASGTINKQKNGEPQFALIAKENKSAIFKMKSKPRRLTTKPHENTTKNSQYLTSNPEHCRWDDVRNWFFYVFFRVKNADWRNFTYFFKNYEFFR